MSPRDDLAGARTDPPLSSGRVEATPARRRSRDEVAPRARDTAARVAGTPSAKERFYFLDLLRAVAAMMVVLYHLIEGRHVPGLAASYPHVAHLTGLGYLGVPIFFVLSGFVISHSLYGRDVDGPSLARFMVKRSIRLDPPYWVALCLTMAAAYVSALTFRDKAGPIYEWRQVAAHVLYLQDALGYRPIGGVFWTLCLELQFYVIYALLLLLAASLFRSTLAAGVLVALAAVGSLAWPLGLAPFLADGLFLPLWYGFLAGALCYWSWRRPSLAPVFALFLAGLVVAGARGDTFAAACATTAVLVYLAAIGHQLARHLGWPVVFIAQISFSLYLIHNPVTGAAFRLAYRVLGHSAATEVAALAFALAINILAASLFWIAVERPCLKLASATGRTLDRRVRMAPAAAARARAMGPAPRDGAPDVVT